jgi:hypothetical protein
MVYRAYASTDEANRSGDENERVDIARKWGVDWLWTTTVAESTGMTMAEMKLWSASVRKRVMLALVMVWNQKTTVFLAPALVWNETVTSVLVLVLTALVGLWKFVGLTSGGYLLTSPDNIDGPSFRFRAKIFQSMT